MGTVTRMLGRLGSLINKEEPGAGETGTPQYAILWAVARAIDRYLADRDVLRDELFVDSAAADYLDVCGRGYGVGRPNVGLNDDEYRELIWALIALPRATLLAIYRVLEILLGYQPTVTELGGYVIEIELGTAPVEDDYGLALSL